MHSELPSDDARSLGRRKSLRTGKSLSEIMRGSNWEVIDIEWRSESHIVPKDDIAEHTLKFLQCKCSPKIDSVINDCTTIVHSAFDNRELYESQH